MKFHRFPSSFSFAISLLIVWALAGATSGKSDTSRVPVTLNDITERKHNGFIDSHVEFNNDRVHSRNLVDDQPNVTSSVCYLDQSVTSPTQIPDGAIVINDQSGTAVGFTINQLWLGSDTLTVKYEIDNLTSQCTIKENFDFGGSEDFEAQCVGEVTSVSIIVHFAAAFSLDECDACNVDEASETDGHFCAYSIEIPCGSVPYCRNAEDPWLTNSGSTRSCSDIAGLTRKKKRDRECRRRAYRENCPGLCDETRCACHDYEYGFKAKKDALNFVTCEGLADDHKKCKWKTVEHNCPGLCDDGCSS